MSYLATPDRKRRTVARLPNKPSSAPCVSTSANEARQVSFGFTFRTAAAEVQ